MRKICYLVRLSEEIPRQARDDAEGRRVIYISRPRSFGRYAPSRMTAGEMLSLKFVKSNYAISYASKKELPMGGTVVWIRYFWDLC